MNTSRYSRWLKRTALALMAGVLVGCGGGGGPNASDGQTQPATVFSGIVQPGVRVAEGVDMVALGVTHLPESNALELQGAQGSLASIQPGQVVFLPASETHGLPLGFAGKAITQPDGKIVLQQAEIGDVFERLSIDYDTARDGGQIAGLIAPKSGKMTAAFHQPSARQAGLEGKICANSNFATFIESILCKDGALEGYVELSHPIQVNKKGTKEKAAATLYARLDFSKLNAKILLKHDKEKYKETGGLDSLNIEASGNWSAKTGIKLTDASESEIPSWSELIRSDEKNIWDTNTKVTFGKYFELSGLNGDDKKGLMPLGGLYFTLENLAGTPFIGDLSARSLGQIKKAAIIVWIYVDISGNITLSGETNFAEANGGSFKKGLRIDAVDGKLVTKVTDDTNEVRPTVFAPRIKGKLEASQTVGSVLAFDALIGGIRPATLKATLMALKVGGSMEGEGGYQWAPAPAGLKGNLCVGTSNELYSAIEARVKVTGALDAGWVDVGASFERAYGPIKKSWWSATTGECINNFTLPLSINDKRVDTEAAGKTKVEMNFAQAYNNAALRNQVGRWQVKETSGPAQPKVFDASTEFGGLFTVSLAPGEYTYTMEALHKDLKDSSGNSVVVAKSSPLSVNVSAAATADFTAGLQNKDCKKLQLTSTSVAGAGSSITHYEWTVTPQGVSASTQQGATLSAVNFTLAACGSVVVQLKITDSNGVATVTTRTINTQSLAPTVTSISPSSSTVNTPVALTVVGTSLPLTAVLEATDATCQTPTSRSSTGFGAVCTFASTGNKTLTVRSANGGTVIDSSRSISIGSGAVSTSTLPHTGITANQCYQAGSNTLVSCTSAGAIALSGAGKQDGMYTNINPMSYSKVGLNGEALADSATSWCAVEDNVTGLLWQNHQSTPSTYYTNYGDNRAGDVSKYATDNATLCGLSGWRLPTVDELETLVDASKPYPGPTINTAWFANTPGNLYWSSSPSVGNSYGAWSVGFSGGGVGNYYRNFDVHVRLVRAGQ